MTVEPAAGGEKSVIEADVMLVAIGRRPYTDGLGLDKVGVALDKRGRVITDEHYRTNVPGIYAIGDCREGPMLAHKAEDEAVAAAEIIAGKAGHVNYDAIPSVVYTFPEVATRRQNRGRTEGGGHRLQDRQISLHRQCPRQDHRRHRRLCENPGRRQDRQGAGLRTSSGPEAGNLIAEVVLAMEFGASSEDIARTCHSHPTLTEAVRQAAMGVEGWTMQM